jgi:AraC family transcriptional regulator, positive regulator of tynA and feaB
MKVLFSTDSVHPRDRLAYWREEATKAFVSYEFSTQAGRNFSGTISAGSLGKLNIAAFESGPCVATRTERCLKSATDDDVLLCRQMGASSAHQDGRDAGSGPGDVYLLDPRRPFSVRVASTTNGLIFKVPRSELEARLGNIASYTALPLSPGQPVAALASDFLAMLAGRADAIDQSMGTKLVQHALDLVALAFEARIGGNVAQLSSTRSTTLLRLKSIIEARLSDPWLKPDMVAEAAGISIRYANALLAHEGTSLERFIMLRRLLRCRQTLESPAHLSLTVGEVAYGCGFSDLSHFTRRFRRQFGCSPGEIRPRPESR